MSISQVFTVSKFIGELKNRGMEFLPNGIIEKSHTGMGATHMELTSHRNSIIVEPIKITAYSKVLQYNKSSENRKNNLRALYVGSEIGAKEKTTSRFDIVNYINSTVKYKKIVCVADSLQRIIDELLLVGKLHYYFLLIDEIDSIQNDSSFRRSLEQCLDIYFMFDKTKRAVLTATPLDFTNEILRNEVKTIFKLENPSRPIIDVYIRGNASYTMALLILRKYSESNGTVVVVLNTLKEIDRIIDTLLNYNISPSDIGVLCSRDNQARMGQYYREMLSDEYPNKICFLTSAYFTGYDIRKPYHLIIYTSVLYTSTLLSGGQIKQIIGRLRNFDHLSLSLVRREALKGEVLSKSLISLRNLNTANIFNSAFAMLKSMNCLTYNMKHYEDELQILKTFRNGALNALAEQNAAIIRQQLVLSNNKIEKGDYVRSDFYIDSKIEQIRVFTKLYDIGTFEKFSEDMSINGFTVYLNRIDGEIKLAENKPSLDKVLNYEFLVALKDLNTSDEYDFYRWLKEKQLLPNTKEIQKIVIFCLTLIKYYSVHEIIHQIVIPKMFDSKKKRMKDSRAFNAMYLSVKFQTAGDDFSPRIFINHYFEIGKVYSRKELALLVKKCLIKSGLDLDMDKKEDKWVITMANQLLILKRSRKSGLDNLKLMDIYPVKNVKDESIFKELSEKDMIKKFIYQKHYLIESESNSISGKINDINEDEFVSAVEIDTQTPKKRNLLKRLNENISGLEEI